MADKFLSELEWKRFSKGRDLKEVPLAKALAALESAKGPAVQLEALDEIEKQAAVLKKGAKNDKELTAWLDGLEKSAAKQRKESEFELKKAAKQEADDEEDDPVLLTSKMIPLLRQVKKGDEVQVLLARGGKEVAVLMSRKVISPSRRKLLTDYLKDGTPKFHKGVCIFEENAYTFVLETQAAGLAKKLKAALLKQVELRLKVRVRGEEGDLDDDGEPAEEDGLEAEEEQGQGVRGSVPEAPPITPPEQANKEDVAKASFEKRWPLAENQVLQMLRDGVGDVSKLRAVAEFVREKAQAGNFAAALQGMTSLEKLMEAARGAPQAPPVQTAAQDGAKPEVKAPDADAETAAFNKRLAALLPEVKAAVASGHAQAQDVKLKLSEAGVFARKREFAQANALLDEAEVLIRAIGESSNKAGESKGQTAQGGGEPGEGEEQDEGEDQDQDEDEVATVDPNDVKDHLMMLGSQLKELAGLPEFADVKQDFDKASLAFRNKSYADAEALLTQIEPQILAALSAARALAAQPGGPTLIAVAKASFAWRTACETARREVAALKGEVIASLQAEDDLDEEELDGVRSELDRLDQIFDKVSPKLTDLIDQAVSAPSGKRREALERMLSLIKRTESDIQSDELFEAVKDNGLREIDLAGPALTALASLRDAVQPALAS